MKIKVKPEDFIVEEIANIQLNDNGEFTILKLTKRFWNTIDVIDFISRKYHLKKELFSRGGLKDRYSLSIQYLSYKGDIYKNLKEKNFTIEVIGKTSTPINLDIIKGNRFYLTIRDLEDKNCRDIEENYQDIKSFGLPNYFDEQRFGSARHKKGFFAKYLLLGHYNGALKSLFYKYKEDDKETKRFKNSCIENWGKWNTIFNESPKKYKGIFKYLTEHPNDFKNAIKFIDRELLNLYLLSYQSFIFNETIIEIIKDYGEGISEIPYFLGNFLFYKKLRDFNFLNKLLIPVINDKTELNGYVGEKIKNILRREGIEIKMFSLNKMRLRGVRFKTFGRRLIVFPENFNFSFQTDEIYKGKKKVVLDFILPSGSYATILIKKLTNSNLT